MLQTAAVAHSDGPSGVRQTGGWKAGRSGVSRDYACLRHAATAFSDTTRSLLGPCLLSTRFRVTLIIVADNQNITLSLPRKLLKQAKRVAADRDTSVSALMTEALGRLADEDRRYSSARKRSLAALRSTRSLGTQGRRSWSRDELHER